MAKTYQKFYLSQPVTIEETMEKMSDCQFLKQVTWRHKNVEKHYSTDVPTIHWVGRGGHVSKFECGTQWGDRRDILVVGHFFEHIPKGFVTVLVAEVAVAHSCSEWLSTSNLTLGTASDVKFDIQIASQPPVRQNNLNFEINSAACVRK